MPGSELSRSPCNRSRVFKIQTSVEIFTVKPRPELLMIRIISARRTDKSEQGDYWS
jgi:uncharacterized DUF497 family protein